MRARKQLSNGFYRVAVFERSLCVVCLLLCFSELLIPHHDDDNVQALCFCPGWPGKGSTKGKQQILQQIQLNPESKSSKSENERPPGNLQSEQIHIKKCGMLFGIRD